jgi:hypothetical protein
MRAKKIIYFISFLLLLTNCNEGIKFDSELWKSWSESENNPDLRWRMHKDLLKSYELKTYDRNKIIDLLGNPDHETVNEYYYNLGYSGHGINIGLMIIIFEKNKVREIKIFDG